MFPAVQLHLSEERGFGRSLCPVCTIVSVRLIPLKVVVGFGNGNLGIGSGVAGGTQKFLGGDIAGVVSGSSQQLRNKLYIFRQLNGVAGTFER